MSTTKLSELTRCPECKSADVIHVVSPGGTVNRECGNCGKRFLVHPPARYFAIVIRGDDSLGGVLAASTALGNWIRAHLELPAGFVVTRSIEISKSMAERTW
jgi:hypothetical protein